MGKCQILDKFGIFSIDKRIAVIESAYDERRNIKRINLFLEYTETSKEEIYQAIAEKGYWKGSCEYYRFSMNYFKISICTPDDNSHKVFLVEATNGVHTLHNHVNSCNLCYSIDYAIVIADKYSQALIKLADELYEVSNFLNEK